MGNLSLFFWSLSLTPAENNYWNIEKEFFFSSVPSLGNNLPWCSIRTVKRTLWSSVFELADVNLCPKRQTNALSTPIVRIQLHNRIQKIQFERPNGFFVPLADFERVLSPHLVENSLPEIGIHWPLRRLSFRGRIRLPARRIRLLQSISF